MKQFPKSRNKSVISHQSPATSSNDCLTKDAHRRHPCEDYNGIYTRKYQIRFKDYKNQLLPQLSIIPNGLILELFNYWQKANKEKRQEWNYLLKCIRLLSVSQLNNFSDKELGEKVYQCLHDTKKFLKENKLSSSIVNHEIESVLEAPFYKEHVRTVKNLKNSAKLKGNEKSYLKPEVRREIKGEEIKIVVDECENFESESCDLTFDEGIMGLNETCTLNDQLRHNSMPNEKPFLWNKQVKLFDKSVISSPISKVIRKHDVVILQNKANVSKITSDNDKCFQPISKTMDCISQGLTIETNKCLHYKDHNAAKSKFLKQVGNQYDERTFTLEECIQAIEEEENFICPNITYIKPPIKVNFSNNKIKEDSIEGDQNVEENCQVERPNVIITENLIAHETDDRPIADTSLMVKQDINFVPVDEKEIQHLKQDDVDHVVNQKIPDGECSIIIDKEESQESLNVKNACVNALNYLTEKGNECLNIDDKCEIVSSINLLDNSFITRKDDKNDGLRAEIVKPLNICKGESINFEEGNAEPYVDCEKEQLVSNNDTSPDGYKSNNCVETLNSQVLVNQENVKIIKGATLNDFIKDKIGDNHHLKISDVTSYAMIEKDSTVCVANVNFGHIKLIKDDNDGPAMDSNDINSQAYSESKDDAHASIHKEKDCPKYFNNVEMCNVSNMEQVSSSVRTDNFIQGTGGKEPATILKKGNMDDYIMEHCSKENLQNDFDHEVNKSKIIVIGPHKMMEGVMTVSNEEVSLDDDKLVSDKGHSPILNSNNVDINSGLEIKEKIKVGSFHNIENAKCYNNNNKDECQIVSTEIDDSHSPILPHNVKNKSESKLKLETASASENNAYRATLNYSCESQQYAPLINNDNLDGSLSVKSAKNVSGSRNKHISLSPILTVIKTNSSVMPIDNHRTFMNMKSQIAEPNQYSTNYVEITTCHTNSRQEYSEMVSSGQILSMQDSNVKSSCLLPHSLDDPMQVLLEACTQIDRDQKEKNNNISSMESSDMLKMETVIKMSTDKVSKQGLVNSNCPDFKPNSNASQSFAKSDSNFFSEYKKKKNLLKNLARYKSKYVEMKSKFYTVYKMRTNAVQALSDYRCELFDAYEEHMSKINLVNQLEDQLKCSKCELSLMKNNIQKLNIEKIDIMKSLIEKSKKIIYLEDKVNELQKTIEEVKEKKPELITMIGGQFTPEVNDVFKELLACNVPIEKIPNIIRISVENLTGMIVTELPFDSFLTETEKDKSINLDISEMSKDYIKKDKETFMKSKGSKKIDFVTKETNSCFGTERIRPIPMTAKGMKIIEGKTCDQGPIKIYKGKTPKNFGTSQTNEKLNPMKTICDLKNNSHMNINESSMSKMKDINGLIEGQNINDSSNKFINRLCGHRLKDNASRTLPNKAIKTEQKNYPNQEREKLRVVLKANDNKLKSNVIVKPNKQLEKNNEVNKTDLHHNVSKRDKGFDLAVESERDKQKRPQRTTANCYEYRQLNNGIYDRRDKESNNESKKSSVKEIVSRKYEVKEKVNKKSAVKDHGKRKCSQIESDDSSSDSDSKIKYMRKKTKHKKYDKSIHKQNFLSSICKDDDNITVEEDGTIVIGNLAKLFGL